MSENQMNSDKLLVRYKNETFDLSKFVQKHPGGRNTLNAVLNSDIDYKFETAMPHSPAAKYLLREYRVSSQMNNNDNKFDCELLNGNVDSGGGGGVESSDGIESSNSISSSTSNGYDRPPQNDFSGHHKTNGHDNIDHLIKTDESMEVISYSTYIYTNAKMSMNFNSYHKIV